MSKFASISFSLPVELSIVLEEHVENEKTSRSELIKKALVAYFEEIEARPNIGHLVQEMHKNILEIKEKFDKQDTVK